MHGYVVSAERVVIERLAVHVDHERVADLSGGLAGVVLQHPGGVDGHVTRGATQDVEDGGRWRWDRPGHLDTVGQDNGVGHVGAPDHRDRLTGHLSMSAARASRAVQHAAHPPRKSTPKARPDQAILVRGSDRRRRRTVGVTGWSCQLPRR